LSARPELRAPEEDGAVLAEPPLAEAGDLIARNRRRLEAVGGELLGRPWSDLRREARQTALAAARRYITDSSGEPAPPPANPESLVVAGHQPELFHPGVWAKNFALAGMSRRNSVTALNLVVDNDTVKSTTLRIPSPATGAVPWPHPLAVAFDRWTGEIPYEERQVLDREEFATFGERAGRNLAGWGYLPLLIGFWPQVLHNFERTSLLGECFARARRTFERRWGCRNLEVTVGDLCGTTAFAWFASHLISELPRFHAIYNDCVHDYRRRHGIRSRNHPVPDLAADGDWLETPFWGWRSGRARRGRLFARVHPGGIDLRTDGETWPSLPPAGPEAPRALIDCRTEGCKVRSRALSNTLYARLFLGDVFVHGIGGGKYDELTDAIIRRFYQVEPPAFIVLTATRLLPLPRIPATADDCRRLKRALRDVHWNPQRQVPTDPGLRATAREREDWVRRRPADKAARRERFQMLRALADRLRAPLTGLEQRLRDDLATCQRQLEANGVLSRRDYSFVVYPEATLRPFCEQFL
jgi:hypothetical protein